MKIIFSQILAYIIFPSSLMAQTNAETLLPVIDPILTEQHLIAGMLPPQTPVDPEWRQGVEQKIRDYLYDYSKMSFIQRLIPADQIKAEIMDLLPQRRLEEYSRLINLIAGKTKSHPAPAYELLWNLQRAWENKYLIAYSDAAVAGQARGTWTAITALSLSLAGSWMEFRKPGKLWPSIHSLNRRMRLIRWAFPAIGWVAGRSWVEMTYENPPSPAQVARLEVVDSTDWEVYHEKLFYGDMADTAAGLTGAMIAGETFWLLMGSRLAQAGRLGKLAAFSGSLLAAYPVASLAEWGAEDLLRKQDLTDARLNFRDAMIRLKKGYLSKSDFDIYWESQQVSRSAQVYAKRLEQKNVLLLGELINDLPEISEKQIERRFQNTMREIATSSQAARLNPQDSFKTAFEDYHRKGPSENAVDVLLQAAAVIHHLNRPYAVEIVEDLKAMAIAFDSLRSNP